MSTTRRQWHLKKTEHRCSLGTSYKEKLHKKITFIELRLVAALATTSPSVAGGSASLRSTSAQAHSTTPRHQRTRIFTPDRLTQHCPHLAPTLGTGSHFVYCLSRHRLYFKNFFVTTTSEFSLLGVQKSAGSVSCPVKPYHFFLILIKCSTDFKNHSLEGF